MGKKVVTNSNLHNCMRDAYEDFAEALCDAIKKEYPRDKKIQEKIKNSLKKMMDNHFGKPQGGFTGFD